jgi:SPP1 gp7 family putative phage head morphogenesis protein
MAVKNNTMTINEVREKHGMPPVDWGNQPFTAMGAAPAAQFNLTMPSNKAVQPLYHPELNPLGRNGLPYLLHLNNVQGVKKTKPIHAIGNARNRVNLIAANMSAKWRGTFKQAVQDILALLDDKAIVGKAQGGMTADQFIAMASKIIDGSVAQINAESLRSAVEAYGAGKFGVGEELGMDLSLTDKDRKQIEAIQQALGTYPIKTFTDDQIENIMQAISDGFQEGADLSLSDIRAKIEANIQQYTYADQWKLDRIVRTEVNRVCNQGRISGYKDGNVQLVNWRTAEDDRVCQQCMDIEAGNPYNLDAAQDMLTDHPNCRCVVVAQALSPEDMVIAGQEPTTE